VTILYRKFLTKLLHDPVGTFKRLVSKQFVEPRKYRVQDDYDAARYWDDRFARYGASLQAVGDEGLSADRNAYEYAHAAKIFKNVLRQVWQGDRTQSRVLEIGPGLGFYTSLLADLGVRHYVGVDITDRFFPVLVEQYPNFKFVRGDVTQHPIPGDFDLVIMIDVIEHIVTDEKFKRALHFLDTILVPGGLLVVAPIMSVSKRHLFHVRFWSKEELQSHLPNFQTVHEAAFREGALMVLRKTNLETQ